MKSILVASEKESEIPSLVEFLSPNFIVDVTKSAEACVQKFHKKRYEILFIDVRLLASLIKNENFKDALHVFWDIFPTMEIVVMSEMDYLREAVQAVKAGASDYIIYPVDHDEILYIVNRISENIKKQSELDYLRDAFWQDEAREIIHTKNRLMMDVFEKVRTIALTKSTVLITGETGTGKGLLAQLIHRHSNRREGPFIKVHLGAVPDTLVESELFGHEKGAFTGADRRKLGKFEIAKDGTIFLDEIGTISQAAQIKLLEVLQDGSFSRVGGETPLQSDARVIAATNSDLHGMVSTGRFRNDLYYRLNVFSIELPPLRQRTEDIPILVEGILRKLNRSYMKNVRGVHPEVLDAFYSYSWPGNIREMENLIERAYLLEKSEYLMPQYFPHELFVVRPRDNDDENGEMDSLAVVRQQGIDAIEKRYLTQVLTIYNGRIKKTAEIAGITPRQLYKLMKKHDIHKEIFKGKNTSNNNRNS